MILFRSAQKSDLDAILNLAQQSGAGMTTLPKSKDLLKQRLQWSCDSYKKTVIDPHNEYYFFVLEDTDLHKIVGTSAIEAKTGHGIPVYSYKVSRYTRRCESLNIHNEYETLNLVTDNEGNSEMCTLFLESSYRKNNNGLLLSKARFLFMAQHPNRFSPTVIAEMRGISNEQGESPFWNHVGYHFFHMSFVEVDRLTLATNKQFIADLLPNNPIYVKLLPQEAQDVIGRPHPSTVPAMTILQKEGFHYNHYVDIFDAGPTIEANRADIKTINSSHLKNIKNFSNTLKGARYLIANTEVDFKATLDYIELNANNADCVISKATAALLNVSLGDTIRIAPL